jgi:hypothetical protein
MTKAKVDVNKEDTCLEIYIEIQLKENRRQIVVECAAVRVRGAQPARDSDSGPRRPLTLDIGANDPRYGPRRSRHARSRYHSRRHGSSLDALSRRDRRVLHDLLLRCRRRAQPPIGAHVVPFFRQKKLRCAVPQEETKKKATVWK